MKTRNVLLTLALSLTLITLAARQVQGFIINWHPVGITRDQTARLTFANLGETRGIVINWRFVDADGAIVARSEQPLTIPIGKMFSVDLDRDTLSPNEGQVQIRAEVELLIPHNPRNNLSVSLEVFDNDTGKTTVFPTETI